MDIAALWWDLVIIHVLALEQGRIRWQVQRNVTSQAKHSCPMCAGWKRHRPAARFSASINRFLNSFRIQLSYIFPAIISIWYLGP